MFKILVSGYYGFNNIGDEAILKGIIDGLKAQEEEIEIVVLSQHPSFTTKKHNVKSVKRMNPIVLLKEIMSCDLLLSGGGSLLQDITSKKSIIYYLFLISLAKFFKKKVMIYSQGIGPVKNTFNRKLMKKILNKVDIINVRDESSKEELIDMGIQKEISVSVDTVFGIKKPQLDHGEEILNDIGIDKNKKTIGISIRPWKNNEDIVREIKNISILIKEKYDCNIVFIPCHFYFDLGIIKDVVRDLNKEDIKDIYILDKYLYVDEYLSLVGNLDLMIGMRLHALIFSVLMEVPVIGISYDPKIDSLLELIGKKPSSDVEHINPQKILEDVDKVMGDLELERKLLKEYNQSFSLKVNQHNKELMSLLKQED